MRFSLSSLRVRIGLLFLLSIGAFTATLLYAYTELQQIRDDIFALNGYYLPLAEEATQLDGSIRQLSREHERYTEDRLQNIRRAPPIFLIQQIQNDALQAKRLHRLARKDAILHFHAKKNSDVASLITAIRSASKSYAETLEKADSEELGGIIAQLDRDRSALNIRIGQLNTRLSDQIQMLSRNMADALLRTVQFFGVLALLVLTFTAALALIATRVIRPIENLTGTVQRIRMGDYADRISDISIISGAEVHALSQEVNAMADAVEERNAKLSERAQALDELSERLQKVLDSVPIGIILVHNQQIQMANPVAHQQWNLSLNTTIPEFLDRASGTFRELNFGDDIFTISVTQFGDHGRLISTENITPQVRNRESLARAQRLALIGRMLAQITHEVRNPLNAMSLNAEMLEEEIQTTDGREMLEIITREIQRLEQTTDRYLTLTRKSPPVLSVESIDDIIAEVKILEGPALELSNIVLRYSPYPQELTIDRESLLRALRNLIRNAREANATQIEIKAGPRMLIVSDNGEGISAESAKHIFDPFFTTKPSGTGLGLAICRQELEEWGAGLTINYPSPSGSEFELQLPLHTPGTENTK